MAFTIKDLMILKNKYDLGEDTPLVVCINPEENDDFRAISDEADLENIEEYEGVVEIDPNGQTAVVLYPEVTCLNF